MASKQSSVLAPNSLPVRKINTQLSPYHPPPLVHPFLNCLLPWQQGPTPLHTPPFRSAQINNLEGCRKYNELRNSEVCEDSCPSQVGDISADSQMEPCSERLIEALRDSKRLRFSCGLTSDSTSRILNLDF